MASSRISTDYLDCALDVDLLKVSIERTAAVLRHLEFDTIAFRGNSGALVAPGVAIALNKDLLLVRKAKNDHSSLRLEGAIRTNKYVIVDDFISSGHTVDAIIDEITVDNSTAECVGYIGYNALHGGRWSALPSTKITPCERRVKMLAAEGVLHSGHVLREMLGTDEEEGVCNHKPV